MEDILSKLVGAASNGRGGGGLDPGALAQMLNGAGGGLSAKDAAALLGEGALNGANEQSLAEDEKMENVGHTYDFFIQNEIPHTSHTLEWLPISHPDPDHPDFEFNYFLLGTHAGEPEDENDQVQFQDELQLSRVRVPLKQMFKEDIHALQKLQKNFSRVSTVSSLHHKDEVIKARAMPQDQSLIASMTNSGLIKLYEMPEIKEIQSKGSDFSSEDFKFTGSREKAEFEGLTSESFALCWNKFQKGVLCSSAEQSICIWKIDSGSQPYLNFENAHNDQIHDVKFSGHADHGGNLLISTSEDGHFKIWDIRDSSKNFTLAYKASEDSLCVGQFNPLNPHLFAIAGDSTGQIQIWDMRMPQQAINILEDHKSQVTVLEWCPVSETILASGSDDKRIQIWDQTQFGHEQARQDYEDGPPELLFPHVYHDSTIEDLQWRPVMANNGDHPFQMTIASLETDKQLQIWQMRSQDCIEKEVDIIGLADYIEDYELE